MGTLLKGRNDDNLNDKKIISTKVLLTVFMLFIGVVCVIPLVFMISMSFKNISNVFDDPLKIIPKDLNFKNYSNVFHHKYYLIWYWNTIVTVITTFIFRFFVVTLAAYAFAKLNFPGKNVLFIILLSSILVVPDTTIVGRFLLYKIYGLNDSMWAIVIPGAFTVYFVFLMRQFFMGIPNELTKAAIIDGCSYFKIYYKIILPLTKPALVTMALFSFIWVWNDFVNPFVFISSVKNQLLSVGLVSFQTETGADIPMRMAGATLGILPPVIVFLVLQKSFISSVVGSAVKG